MSSIPLQGFSLVLSITVGTAFDPSSKHNSTRDLCLSFYFKWTLIKTPQ